MRDQAPRTIALVFAWMICVVLSATTLPAQQPDGSGGGSLVAPDDHISDQERARIWAMLEPNIVRGSAVQAHPLLAWPLRAMPVLTDYGYHGISNFVDQNPSFPGSLLDYNCGARTYDQASGYNHQGIDYFTWPFPWNKMDDLEVAVVAAAPGTIIGKDDGNFDRSCGFNNDPWNAVYIQHDDLSIAWYGHLKDGSLTAKPVLSRVETGEFLGIVGSSGNSTAPHLHLELFDSTGALNEPYDGPCNSMNPGDSWWASQRPYYDSAVNQLTTGFTVVDHGVCPDPGRPHDALDYNVGDAVYFTTFYRDQLDTQTSTYTIYRPDGSIWTTWDHVSNAAHYDASWWYWFWASFASGGPTGVWRFEVAYEGETYERLFRLTDLAGSGRVPGQLDDPQPLTAAWDGSQLTLDWARSCVGTDTDYQIYEGSVGSWYSHDTTIACTTAGATTATFTPDAGNRYYLVVPTDTAIEGSYGFDSLFTERPQGAANCLSQQIGGNCPGCGDGVVETPEVCDDTNLGGESCVSQGFGSGILACSPDCLTFDTTACDSCGNDVCEPLLGENCVNCANDCNGQQSGNPGNQFCCGDGGGTNPVGCGDSRCTSSGFSCVE